MAEEHGKCSRSQVMHVRTAVVILFKNIGDAPVLQQPKLKVGANSWLARLQ